MEKEVKTSPGAEPLQVLIVSRDVMTGEILASVLARDNICHATAVRYADLLRAVSANHVDVVVIASEVKYKSQNGLDLAQEIAAVHPDVKIVLLVDQTTQASVLSAFRSGAYGVFSRERPMAEFLDCITHVGKGLLWAGRDETSFIRETLRSIPAPNPAGGIELTMREMQVVRCAAGGKTNREIASELSLSENTVKNYLFRAFEKLGVSSRVELLFTLTLRGQMRAVDELPGLENVS